MVKKMQKQLKEIVLRASLPPHAAKKFLEWAEKDANEEKQHLTWELKTNGAGAYHYEKEYVQTGTKTVEDKEWVKPWDEKVKSGGHWEYR